MARSVVRRSFRGGSVERRKTVWAGITETRSALPGASGTVLFTGFSAAVLALRPFTIVRVRGMWHISSDQEIADETQQVALGFAIVSDRALAAGAGSVPRPFSEISSDLWFSHDIMFNEFLLGTAVGFSGDFGVSTPFGSKAMRKVADGEDIAVMIQSSPTSGGVFVSKAGRMLLKLH